MMISCSFICVFAALVNKVSLQVTVEAVIGGSVVLPCSSAEHDFILQDIEVSWRHNGSKNVCDLIPHSNSIETQDTRYKNRAEAFPEEYLRGNFSIKLSGLTHADAGKYICYITPSDEQKTVEMIIKEPTTEKGNKTTDQENQEETRPDSVEKSWLWILVGTLITIILIILIIVIIFRRKICSCLMSGEHSLGSDAHEVVSPGRGYKSVTADDRNEAGQKMVNDTDVQLGVLPAIA